MHNFQCWANRLTDMRTFACSVTKLAKKAEEDLEKRTDCGNLIVAPHRQNTLRVVLAIKNTFFRMTADCATECQQASQFKFDVIKHVNPSSEMVNKMFVRGIEPHCETSHDGTKEIFLQIG